MTGLAKTDWTWAVKIADFDNDGWNDVFVTNGMIRNYNDSDTPVNREMRLSQTEWEYHKNTPPRKETNMAFRNLGDLRFDNVGSDWGVDHLGMSYAAAYSDLDRDGDLDLIVANLDEPIHLYENHTSGKHRILIRLKARAATAMDWARLFG